MTLGEQLKRIRVNKGLSQPELAELSTIEQSYLSKLENDKKIFLNDENEISKASNSGFIVSSYSRAGVRGAASFTWISNANCYPDFNCFKGSPSRE